MTPPSIPLVAPMILAGAALAGQATPSLHVAFARFRQSADTVRLHGVIRVPTVALERLARGAAYRATITVAGVDGREVYRRTWPGTADPAALERPRGVVVEHVKLVLPDAEYRVVVSVTDSGSGRRLETSSTIQPLPPASPLSDLLILRPSGDYRAPVGYYLELYNGTERAPGRLSLQVTERAAVRWTTPPEQIPPFSGAHARRGSVDVAHLPPGDYLLVATAELGGRRATRSVPLDLAGPGAPPVLPAPRDTFGLASDAQLDSLAAPLVLIMTDGERQGSGGLSAVERRAFLRAFWSRRDPTVGTPRNEALEDFYARVREVNRRFGWRTDRGRVYIRRGAPDTVLSRPKPLGTNPYEVWRYRGGPYLYVFLDLTWFGDYALIWTNDRLDAGRPNWRELLGPEALDDIARF